MVMACCSAMPTSKTRSGNRSPKVATPVPVGMPAVMATTRSSSEAMRTSSAAMTAV